MGVNVAAIADKARTASNQGHSYVRRWRLVVAVACIVVFAYTLFRELHVSQYVVISSDFSSYYVAALAVRHGSDPLAPVASWIQSYRPTQPLVASYYVYTPFFALLIVPFTVLPLSLAFTLWGLCNAAALLGSVASLLSISGRRVSWLSVLVLTTLAALLPPVRFEFTWGQADVFVLFCVCAALWVRQRDYQVAAGVLLAIACVTKPPLLLLVAFLYWKREGRFATSALVSFLLLLLAPFTWLGGTTFTDQLTVWRFWSNDYVPFIDNQSPKGVLARLFSVNPSAHPVVVAPALITLGWLLVVGIVGVLTLSRVAPKPLKRNVLSVVEVGLVIAMMLLISPLTEYIYVTLLVFSMVSLYLLLRSVSWRRVPFVRVAVGLAVFAVLVCLPLQHIEYFFWPRMIAQSWREGIYILLGAPYLYVLAGYFSLHFYALGLVRQSTVKDDLLELRLSVLERAHGLLGRLRDLPADLRGSMNRTTGQSRRLHRQKRSLRA